MPVVEIEAVVRSTKSDDPLSEYKHNFTVPADVAVATLNVI